MEIQYLKLFWVCIKLYHAKGRAYGITEYIVYENMTFQVRSKWNWYFKYRAALLQVKNPRCLVEISEGRKNPNAKTIVDFLRDKIIGKKRTITKFKNRLIEYEKTWDSLFPIEDDDSYDLAKAKIRRLENELVELEKQMSQQLTLKHNGVN